MLLDITHSRSDERRRRLVDGGYIVGSLVLYGAIWAARA